MEQLISTQCFDGQQQRWRHYSKANNCDMVFSIFLPPQSVKTKVPVLYWLSGLTCNDQNFVTKSGFQKYATKYGIAVVAPDTSPRGENVPDDKAWDFGQGASFYVDATQRPWSSNFQMNTYIAEELFELIAKNFPIDATRSGIAGHSMGGHGALILGLKNPDRFRSISAFAPICSPTNCPWGIKAFTNYLGEKEKFYEVWRDYDACELLKEKRVGSNWRSKILVDQGSADEFLTTQLNIDKLVEASQMAGIDLEVRYRSGYDHSYFFITTFIEDHIYHHVN